MMPFKILLKKQRLWKALRTFQNNKALWYYHNTATRWAEGFLHKIKLLQKVKIRSPEFQSLNWFGIALNTFLDHMNFRISHSVLCCSEDSGLGDLPLKGYSRINLSYSCSILVFESYMEWRTYLFAQRLLFQIYLWRLFLVGPSQQISSFSNYPQQDLMQASLFISVLEGVTEGWKL